MKSFKNREKFRLEREDRKANPDKYKDKELEKDPDFESVKSSASCRLSDIEGILFGGSNARFWMLRKHFNSMTREELKYAPFYSWHCISIQLNNREVNLCILNERDMTLLLKLILNNMYTMDG